MKEQYQIVEDDNINDLSVEVSGFLNLGWKLWGFPFVHSDNHRIISRKFCQAMTKSEEA